MRSILRRVLAPLGIVHRFLLAQEFRLLVVMLVLAPVPWLIEYGQHHALFADRHVLQEIRPELGRAAFVDISGDVQPAIVERGFRLCEIRPEFSLLLFRCFDASLGATLHEVIRRVGRGFHDYDGERLRFSSSDESNPADNGRVYLVAIPWWRGEGGETATGVRVMVETARQASIALFAWVLVSMRMWPWIRERGWSSTFSSP